MADAKMPKPVDMKMSAKQAMGMGAIAGGNSPRGKMYPWGMSINLDSAALDKLGIKDLPDAGCECVIQAVGEVTRVEKSANGTGKSRSMTIQITKLAIQCDEDADEAFKQGYKRGPKRKGY